VQFKHKPNQKGETMKHIAKFIALLGLLALSSLVISRAQAGEHPDSGVTGQVFIGPTCPHIRPGFDCPDRPFQTSITVRTLHGRIVRHFTTDAQGRFRVSLKPGRYVLVGRRGLPRAQPTEVTVARHIYTTVTITYDSGLR
jgi:hypothetical protein